MSKKLTSIFRLCISLVSVISVSACASTSSNIQAPSSIPISSPTPTVSAEPSPASTPTETITPAAEPSPTKSPENKKSVKSSPSPTISSSAAPTKKPSAKPSATPSAGPSDKELAAMYPPEIGKTAPWYMPTIDTIAKAYTNTKPYEVGNNYALVNEGSYILYVYLTDSNSDFAYWTGRKILNLDPSKIKVFPNVLLNIGKGNIVTAKYPEESDWRAIYSNETIDTNNLPYNIKNQIWGPLKVIN